MIIIHLLHIQFFDKNPLTNVKGVQIQLCPDSNVTVGEVPKVEIDE